MPRNLLPKAMNCLNRASIAFVRLGRFSKIASPRPPSLEDLARTVGTNAKRLSKDFQILHGMTVFAWLREYRLRQAADLLRTSQLSVSEIADRLGFSSGPNFSTLFKERFQVTPRQYRTSSV